MPKKAFLGNFQRVFMLLSVASSAVQRPCSWLRRRMCSQIGIWLPVSFLRVFALIWNLTAPPGAVVLAA